MTAQLAGPTHASLIRQLLDDYYRDIGMTSDSHLRPTLARIRTRIAQDRTVAAIDPAAKTYCELKLEDGQHIEVDPWFPRGPSLRLLVPVLAVACREMKARHPATGSHTVSGVFSYAVDAQGQLDRGQGIAATMQQFLVDDRGQSVVRLDRRRDGLVEPYATLDDLLMVFDRLGL